MMLSSQLSTRHGGNNRSTRAQTRDPPQVLVFTSLSGSAGAAQRQPVQGTRRPQAGANVEGLESCPQTERKMPWAPSLRHAESMNLYYQALQRSGGIARAQLLEDLGVSRHHQRALVARGKLIRPLRGWLALPNVDAGLIFAVQHGVILTCVSVTQRLGLWTKQKPGMHVAARNMHASHGKVGQKTHWAAPVVQRAPFTLIDPVENALAYVAKCQPREEAHAVWESALRKGLVERTALARLPLGPVARALLEECTEFSDSGLESFVLLRVRALRLRVAAQAWLSGHRVDFLVEGWLVLQIDGSQHEGAQRDADNRHDALLSTQGYAVIRLSYRQMLYDWPEAQRLIMLRLSQGRPA